MAPPGLGKSAMSCELDRWSPGARFDMSLCLHFKASAVRNHVAPHVQSCCLCGRADQLSTFEYAKPVARMWNDGKETLTTSSEQRGIPGSAIQPV
jgi:hypothetical protein